MTLLELAPAAAGAGIQAVDARKGALQHLHHSFGFAATPEQAGHDLHRKINVVEKILKPGAQVIETWFAIRRQEKAVLRALAVTGEAYVAFQAETWQAIAFILAEF